MSVEIVMPKLSDTMEEGTILKWLKQVGEKVARGEVLAEVETDKADMELEAAEGGVLQEIRVGEGESAAVGAVIALSDEKGDRQAAGSARTEPSRDEAAPTGTRRAAAQGSAAAGKSDAEAQTRSDAATRTDTASDAT